jgi:uncharacterized peroxidase-related enzyme
MNDDTMNFTGFLAPAPASPEVQALFDEDVAGVGYVMNLSRLWAYQPAAFHGFVDLLGQAASAAQLNVAERGALVTSCASVLGDSYCALSWGAKLAAVIGADGAAGVLHGDDNALTDRQRALAVWARQVARDANRIGSDDVQQLRDVGFNDAQIFAITLFVAARIMFLTVNDALGAAPDAALRDTVPAVVQAAVGYGRPIDGTPPSGRST